MQTVTLTNHARKRILERCIVSDEELKKLLEAGAGVVIHLLKGGRYVQRLVYSPKDEDWFMVAQDARNGVILTVMPLSYLKGRVDVTAQVKRQARRRALDAAKSISASTSTTPPPATMAIAPEPTTTNSVQTTTDSDLDTITASNPVPAAENAVTASAWRIRVRYMAEGRIHFKNLPRVPREFGSPATWSEPGPIHPWLREQLIDAIIPFAAIDSIFANSNSKTRPSQLVDFLLEHLPLTQEEIACCR